MKSNDNENMRTSSASDRRSRLRSMDDDNCSVILRPIHHVNNVCLCYDDPADCTTCTEVTEPSDNSKDMFYLDESEEEFRLSGGSSPDVSSSDGSSLFDSDFLRSVEHNLNCDQDHPPVLLEQPSIQPALLEQKAKELEEAFNSNSTALSQMMTMHGYQTGVIGDEIASLEDRVRAEKRMNVERIDNLEVVSNPFEISLLLIEKCKKELETAEEIHAEHLESHSLLAANMEKAREIRKNLSKLDEFDKKCEFWTDTQREILDDVSTCQSFCGDDL